MLAQESEVYLYNAIVALQDEGYTKDDILMALGMLEQHYTEVMDFDRTGS